MAVVSTGLSEKGLRSEFFNRFDAANATAHYNTLATRIASNSDKETYKWLGTVPNMREWGTGRLAKGLRTESYSVENLKYESTLEVDKDEISDDQTGQIMVRVGELGVRAATHKDKMIADLFVNGSTAGFNSYDGVPFFDASHSSGASGAQSNELTFDISAVTPSEPNLPDNPSLFSMSEALGSAMAQMMTFLDDQGEPMDIQPNGLTLVCAPQVFNKWRAVVAASAIPQTPGILIPSALPQSAINVISMGRLTDVSKFYLCKTDGIVRPFIFQDREPIEFAAVNNPSDATVFNTEKYLFGVRARYRITYGYWQYAISMDLI